jgi:hypothetical protein
MIGQRGAVQASEANPTGRQSDAGTWAKRTVLCSNEHQST